MSSMRCPNCNFMNWATAESCKKCRTPFYSAGPADYNAAAPEAAAFSGGNEGGWAQTGTGQAGWSQPQGGDAGWNQAGAGQANWGQQASGRDGWGQAGAGQANWGQAGGGQPGWGQPAYGGHGSGGSFPYQLDAPQKTGGAIASLVLGIVSVPLMMACGLGLITGIIGMITGIVSLRKANREPQVYGGKGMAIGGIAASGVAMAMSLMIMAIAVPNLGSRRAANEGSAQSSLRTIHGAEQTYQATKGNGQYGTLQELKQAGLIDANLGAGVKNGYKFRVSVSGDDFEATAVPESYGSSGNRSFFIASEGVIHGASKHGLDANASDPTVGGRPGDYSDDDSDDVGPGSRPVPAGYHPASESSAIKSLRVLHQAEVTYQATVGAGKFGTLEQLSEQKLIDSQLATGAKDGYTFRIRVGESQFSITGTPKAEYVLVGDDLRSFYINESGQILGAKKQGAAATSEDPPAF